MGILRVGCWRRVPVSTSLAIYEGSIGGANAVLAISGVGRASAEATSREVLQRFNPISILSLGFAGGLAHGQRAGDLVVARTLIPMCSLPNGDHEPCDFEPLTSHPALSEKAEQVLVGLGLRHESGACVTGSSVVPQPEAKERLSVDTGALAVDMESYWTGMACREFRVPFLAVRSIVDEVERTLPDYAVRVALAPGPQSMWKHVLPALSRPWKVPGLIQVAFAAKTARKSLTDFAVGFIGAQGAARLSAN